MLQILELLAVLSGACFGILLARAKQMDLVGVCSVAFVVAFGGGTLRDLLLDRAPLFWIANAHYVWIVLGLAVIGALVPRLPTGTINWLHLPDALGMGLFSVVGAAIALQAQSSLLVAVMFGVITGTFGGVIADIVVNDVPNLFKPSTPLYATCSFVGCWLYFGALELGVDRVVSQWSAVAVIVLMRMAALRWQWSLPAPRG